MRRYIWNIEDCDNESLKSDCEVANGVEISNEEWVEIVYDRLNDARNELDIEVQGVIVCFAIMGLWHGLVPGSSVYGSNVSGILHSPYEPCWFGEDGDIRGMMIHHDGTNRMLYRIAPDMETAKELAHAIAYDGLSEEAFKAKTTSLYPVVAKILGWEIVA